VKKRLTARKTIKKLLQAVRAGITQLPCDSGRGKRLEQSFAAVHQLERRLVEIWSASLAPDMTIDELEHRLRSAPALPDQEVP
jgi:hypothetical protein